MGNAAAPLVDLTIPLSSQTMLNMTAKGKWMPLISGALVALLAGQTRLQADEARLARWDAGALHRSSRGFLHSRVSRVETVVAV
jgi:hypothetical protein